MADTDNIDGRVARPWGSLRFTKKTNSISFKPTTTSEVKSRNYIHTYFTR